KTALAQCLQGKGGTLRAQAIVPGQANAAFDFSLARVEHDGEPAVRVTIALKRSDDRVTASEPSRPQPASASALTPTPTPTPAPVAAEPAASTVDATTGLLQRRHFIERLQKQLAQPLKAGIRQIACIDVDKLSTIIEQLGPIAIDDFYGQFAALVRENLTRNDLAGTFGNGAIVALLERPTGRDTEAWAKALTTRVATHVFHIADKSVICTCSVGIGMVDLRVRDASQPLNDALQARDEAQAHGGNQLHVIDHSDADTKCKRVTRFGCA
ncbi:MAG TPA: diguanylate cyclase, partial [Steroidobacteraceae bacterium]|nr:diguanylate cyclase [Steroidobacteraceae bacterium]